MKVSLFAVALCSGLLACDSSDSDVEPNTADSGMSDPPPKAEVAMEALAPSDSHADKTLEQWAIEYMRWAFSQTSCKSPAEDADGSRCGLYQDPESPVFFFERASFTTSRAKLTSRTKCKVPAGRAIVVPVSMFWNDNAGVAEPLPDDEIQASVAKARDSMRAMILKADGQDVPRLSERGVGPVTFSYRIPPAPNAYSCNEQEGVEDTVVEPSYFAGYLAIFAPPAPGPHELEYASVFTYSDFDFSFHVKTNFVVDSSDE